MAPTTSAESRALMVRITAEIWDQGRVDLVDELIAGTHTGDLMGRWGVADNMTMMQQLGVLG